MDTKTLPLDVEYTVRGGRVKLFPASFVGIGVHPLNIVAGAQSPGPIAA